MGIRKTKPSAHGKRPGNLGALARELAERIERLPNEVEAWCTDSGELANSRIVELQRIVERIRFDGAAVADWVQHHRHPGDADHFKEQLEELQRRIGTPSLCPAEYGGQEVYKSAGVFLWHLEGAARSLPKVLRGWADEIDAEAKPPPDPPYTLPPPNQFQWRDGDPIKLSPYEWKLLAYCLNHRRADVQDVIEAVWGHDSDRTINNCSGTVLSIMVESPARNTLRRSAVALARRSSSRRRIGPR